MVHIECNVQKHAQDTSFFTFLLHGLTVSQSTSSEHCTAPLHSDSIAMLLRLRNGRFIINIKIKIVSTRQLTQNHTVKSSELYQPRRKSMTLTPCTW